MRRAMRAVSAAFHAARAGTAAAAVRAGTASPSIIPAMPKDLSTPMQIINT